MIRKAGLAPCNAFPRISPGGKEADNAHHSAISCAVEPDFNDREPALVTRPGQALTPVVSVVVGLGMPVGVAPTWGARRILNLL
jgi:hypothetical protein